MSLAQAVIATLAYAVAALLLAAAVTKVADLAAFRDTLESYGLPRTWLIHMVAAAVPVAEFASAGLVLIDVRVGAGAMAGLLLAFTVAGAIAGQRGARPNCGCFDPVGSGSLGVWTFTRNGILLGACAAALVLSDGRIQWSLGLACAAGAVAACLLVGEAVRGALEAMDNSPLKEASS